MFQIGKLKTSEPVNVCKSAKWWAWKMLIFRQNPIFSLGREYQFSVLYRFFFCKTCDTTNLVTRVKWRQTDCFARYLTFKCRYFRMQVVIRGSEGNWDSHAWILIYSIPTPISLHRLYVVLLGGSFRNKYALSLLFPSRTNCWSSWKIRGGLRTLALDMLSWNRTCEESSKLF